MVREANKNDLDEILQLYLYLHEKSVPEDSENAGYNSSDKTAFIQWINTPGIELR